MNEQDQIYIDSVQEQIDHGMYHDLFAGRGGLVFLDIGANIGLVTKYAIPYCKRIIAVEPSPDTFDVLFNNTRPYSKIECVQAALAPSDGFVPFYVNDINFTASSTVNTYGKQIMVEGATLGTILLTNNLRHVDVAKIDIEGEEGRALTFDQLSNAAPIIDTYFIEMHNCPFTDWQHKMGTIISYLLRLGYHNQKIDGMSVTASKS